MTASALLLALAPLFCAAVNVGVDRIIYKPLRTAPKLSGIVSAIGVSFVFMNIGVFWFGPTDQNFPDLLGAENLLGEESPIRIRIKDLLGAGEVYADLGNGVSVDKLKNDLVLFHVNDIRTLLGIHQHG